MRKTAFLMGTLVFALTVMLAGCRELTADLHDTYDITLFPGEKASVSGLKSLVMRTDGRGRLPELPVPVRGKWDYSCDLQDEWGNPHRNPGVCEFHGCENFLREPDGSSRRKTTDGSSSAGSPRATRG